MLSNRVSDSAAPPSNAQDGSGSLFFTKPWYALGSEISGRTPGEQYMNDNAVRARAGLLNITAWLVLTQLVTSANPQFLSYTVGPLVGYDMLVASIFGLVPLSPYGVVGTMLAWPFKPVWKPAGPKRFAWSLGVVMVLICVVLGQYRLKSAALAVNVVCITLTWAEAVLGFCLGCWTWNNVLVPLLGKKKCTECTMEAPKAGTVARVAEVQRILDEHPLVVFSKSFCPHCKRAKGLLEELKSEFKVVEIDSTEDKDGYAAALVELTGQRTVPNIFIGKNSIGGADSLFELHKNDQLCQLLIDARVPSAGCPVGV